MSKPDQPSASPPRGALHHTAFFLLGGLIVAAVLLLHRKAGLTLPVPWGDEAYFVWQARAFAQSNSFIAPELDSTRPLLLLPFVYQAVMGVVFKVFGYSLENARYLSLAFVVVAFGLLAGVVRRHRAALPALLLVGLVFINGYFVSMANNARMEAFLVAVVCGALLLLQQGRVWPALALLAASPMIHPNGMFFLLPALAYAFFARGAGKVRPDRLALAILAIALLCWLANGAYALKYWDGFMHETAFRVGESTDRHGGGAQFGGWHAAGLVLIAVTAALGAWRRAAVGHLLVFALGCWLCHRVRPEQWYEPYGNLAYLLVALAWLEMVAGAGRAPGRGWRPWAAVGLATLAAVVLLRKSGAVEGPRRYPAALQVSGMHMAGAVPYFTPEDAAAIARALAVVKPGRPITVEVYPWGDALLLTDIEAGRVRFQVPYFDPLFQNQAQFAWGYGPTPAAAPDVYLLRTSRYQPQWLDARLQMVVTHALQQAGVAAPTIVRQRDDTETWSVIDLSAPRP